MKKTTFLFFLLATGLTSSAQTIELKAGLSTPTGNIDYLNSGLMAGLGLAFPVTELVFITTQIDYRDNPIHDKNFIYELPFGYSDQLYRVDGGSQTTFLAKTGLKILPSDFNIALSCGTGLAFSDMDQAFVVDRKTNKKVVTLNPTIEKQGKPLLYTGIAYRLGSLSADLTWNKIFLNYDDLTFLDFTLTWNFDLKGLQQ